MQAHQLALVLSVVCEPFNEIRSFDNSFNEGINHFESRPYSAA
jgi:hypothetical protein